MAPYALARFLWIFLAITRLGPSWLLKAHCWEGGKHDLRSAGVDFCAGLQQYGDGLVR